MCCLQSLMTGLMYYRPEDHITYLQECLRKVQSEGAESVRWNLFIQQRLKTPLPPITPENGRSSQMMDRDPSFITGNHDNLSALLNFKTVHLVCFSASGDT